jgi:hypothetical protein
LASEYVDAAGGSPIVASERGKELRWFSHVPTPRSAITEGVVTDAKLRAAYAPVVQSLHRHIGRHSGASPP